MFRWGSLNNQVIPFSEKKKKKNKTGEARVSNHLDLEHWFLAFFLAQGSAPFLCSAHLRYPGLLQPTEPFVAHHDLIPHPSDFKGFMEIPDRCVPASAEPSNNPIHLDGISPLISQRFTLYVLFTASSLPLSLTERSHPLPCTLPGFMRVPLVTLWPFVLLASG